MRKTNSILCLLASFLIFNIVYLSLAQERPIVGEDQQTVSDTHAQRMLLAAMGSLYEEDSMSVNPLFPLQNPPNVQAHALWALGWQMGMTEMGAHQNFSTSILQDSLSKALDMANLLDCIPQNMIDRLANFQSRMQRASSSNPFFSEIQTFRIEMATEIGNSCLGGGSTPSVPDLSGTWYLRGGLNRPCSITQSGNRLNFTNENGRSSAGNFVNDTTVVATGWQGGLRGTITSNRNRINWANGTFWTRSPN